jgi:FkbM family methyltransferase|tara:strand:- start:1145 stop:1918 length:774 start_codon:yes stop_codon:yes gene_type:complete
MKNVFSKLKILFKSRKIFKNWYIYPKIYFKLTKKEYAIFETKFGQKIKIRVNSTDLMALTHVWLIEEYAKKNFDIKSSDTVIDVGAHIGLFTLYASQSCKIGNIYSYEPVKENFEILKENMNINNLKNVKIFNLAVSNSNSTITLFMNNDESGHSMFSESSENIIVKSTSLMKIFDDNKIKECNFLKLDCEGAEYEIIEKLPSTYFEMIEKIIIEYHMVDSHPELLEKLQNKLSANNFKFETKILFSDIGFLYATKN